MPDRTLPHPVAFRAIMGALGATQAFNGVWAIVAPRSFYDHFPLGRGGWVSTLPAYSEHLMTDVGTLFLGTGVLLLAATVSLERRLAFWALLTYALFSVPHAVWHFTELGPYETTDAVGNVVTLTLTAVLPLILLALLRRPAPAAAARSTGPGDDGARIAGVPESTRNPFLRYAFREGRRQTGRVPVPIAVTAHAPGLLAGYGAFEMATERARRVPVRLKDLAVLKAAQLAGCEWCLDFGSQESRGHGVTEDEQRALLDHRNAEVFSDLDRLVLDYAEAVTRTPVEVPEEMFARLRQHFDEGQLVELTSVIALENYRARFNWALGIGSEDFSEGAYCVPPQLAQAAAS